MSSLKNIGKKIASGVGGKKRKPIIPSTPSVNPTATPSHGDSSYEYDNTGEQDTHDSHEVGREIEDIIGSASENPQFQSSPTIPSSGQSASMLPPRSRTLEDDDGDGEADDEDDGDANSGVTMQGRKVSWAWKFFQKDESAQETGDGRATCSLCMSANVNPPKSYMMKKGGGTGSLTKHLRQSHGITKDNWNQDAAQRKGKRQSQLHGYVEQMPGGGMPFVYNRERMIDELAVLTIADELPFSYGESKNLEYYNRIALQPQYRSVPRNTLKRRTQAQYLGAKLNLSEMFRNLDTRVCLTTDCWTSTYDEPFMCVTAHWLDKDWFLQKRIIGFEVMYESHNGFNIKTRLLDVCKRFNIYDKVFSLSVDNATANTKAVDYLKSDQSFPKILGGTFFHIRCCAHVLNLAAQDGLVLLQPLILPIRTVVRWLRSRGDVKKEYCRLCKAAGLKKKLHPLDCKTRWNSTYIMLSGALKYREVLSSVYNTRALAGEEVTDAQWDLAAQVCNVLKSFFDATFVFSYTYQPSVHLVLYQAVQVVFSISSHMEVTELQPILTSMKSKWLNYFGNIPVIYTIACILDPSINYYGTVNLLEFYYDSLGKPFDLQEYLTSVKKVFHELYLYYAAIYKPEVLATNQPPTSRFNPAMANIIYRSRGGGSGSGSGSSNTTEIDEYMATRWEIDANFKILEWWHNRVPTFPVLSRIARDILAIPASTVASESAFSAGRRVLDEKRSRLTPDSIQMCVCKKDWDQAEKRTQGWYEEEDEDSDDPFMQLTSDSGASTEGEGSVHQT